MNSYGRILRLAIAYRFTLALSLTSALGVAILWGVNIGAVYPFVEVVFKNESMQKWVDEKIVEAQRRVAEERQRSTPSEPTGRDPAGAAGRRSGQDHPGRVAAWPPRPRPPSATGN